MAKDAGAQPLSNEDVKIIRKGLEMLDASLKRMAAKASSAVLAGILTDRAIVRDVDSRVSTHGY